MVSVKYLDNHYNFFNILVRKNNFLRRPRTDINFWLCKDCTKNKKIVERKIRNVSKI